MDFRLDAWHGDYAFPYEPEPLAEEDVAPETVDVTVEAPAHDWAPVRPDAAPFPEVRFVDGVQCSDAVVWIDDGDGGPPAPGLVASWAAGVIRCRAGGPVIEDVLVQRGVFSDARTLGPIVVENLVWRPHIRQPGDTEELPNRLRTARRRLEDEVGRVADDGSLVVYDGLLHAGPRPALAVGLAKRAHRVYLPTGGPREVIRRLRAGERTPLFVVDPARGRYSCYLALADPQPPLVADPASGVARLECEFPAGTPIGDIAAFVDRVAATLPAFASEPHHDPRAPQNLAPVRSLETELRRLLGRPTTIRPLLAAAAAAARRAA